MHRPSSPTSPRRPQASRRLTKTPSNTANSDPTSAPGGVEVAAVSMRVGTSVTRRDALRKLVGRLFLGPGARVLLLPGVQQKWPTSPAEVMAAAADVGASVLFEAWHGENPAWVASDATGAPLPVSIRQTFGNSGEANVNPGLVDDLLALCAPGGERTIALGGVRVGLLCCGENNVLRNAQADGNRVSIRHYPGARILDHVPVVFNGAHSNMGNWGKLDKRFEFLSQGGRLSLYATNNGADRPSWRSALRAWHDGRKLADGEEVFDERLSVRLVSADDDSARALVVRLGSRS